MNHKDLDRNLDNLIIDGLIKEVEQDNADFEAAMLYVDDEEFEELIGVSAGTFVSKRSPTYAKGLKLILSEENACYSFNESDANDMFSDLDDASESKPEIDPMPIRTKNDRRDLLKRWRPWIAASIAAVAIILIVLVPSISSMNGRLCDSALLAAQSYLTPSYGDFDVAGATIDDLKRELPAIEARYNRCILKIGAYTTYSADLQDAGWTLTLAYLRLHKKSDAVGVLKVLAEQYDGTEFGAHCLTLLKLLD